MNEQIPIPEASSKARLRLWLRLLKLTRHIEGEVRDHLRTKHATTLPRFDVMAALYREERGLKMSELSGALRVSNGNVTGIVDRLVDEGQIQRVPVPGDRRSMMVRLTPRGRVAFAAMACDHEAWIDDLLSSLDGASADVLAQQLAGLAQSVEDRG